VEVATAPIDANVSDEEVKSKDEMDKSKKRKREELPEELEIDVSLPEPPSKKALRKSKKSKSAPTVTTKEDGEENGAEEPAVETADKPAKEEKERKTDHSIWIGNLPWTATKQELRDWFQDQGSILPSQITRLHMPAPSAQAAKDTRGRPAFKNKGFAYVDFDSQETLFSALQLTETPFYRSGRNVLVKNAKSFEGRPEEHVNAAKEDGGKGRGGRGGNEEKPPSKRVFIGNLAFEVTKEDLESHFGQCGAIEGIHMATFEDSGKCKGYAWITFAALEAAESAVKGFILKEQDDEEVAGSADQGGDEGVEGENKVKAVKKRKPRKWFVNRFMGREIKREYAEDASVRYKKRYGSERKRLDGAEAGGDDSAPIREVNGDEGVQSHQKNSSHDRRREQRRAQKYGGDYKKVDARTIAPGAALSNAPRASAAINTQGKQGTKVTFD